MRMKFVKTFIIGLSIMAMAIPSYAGQATVLTDAELDEISAKGLPEVFWEILTLSSGGIGDYMAGLYSDGYTSYDLGNSNTVSMSGQAQQNLQTLTNIIAVNSAINCQINLTVITGDNFSGDVHQVARGFAVNFVL